MYHLFRALAIVGSIIGIIVIVFYCIEAAHDYAALEIDKFFEAVGNSIAIFLLIIALGLICAKKKEEKEIILSSSPKQKEK
jgi:DMSO/TMAO reductase YedYZ heme-binding membrane subunit